MNKKYFVKLGKFQAKLDSGECIIGDTVFFGDTPIREAYQNVLYICTRDIQIGDSFYENGILSEYLFDEEHKYDFENYPDFRASVFKIIGEVSPHATWVNEGMQFDGSQLSFPCNGEETFNYLNNEEFNRIIKDGSYPVNIQCPCCGEFK